MTIRNGWKNSPWLTGLNEMAPSPCQSGASRANVLTGKWGTMEDDSPMLLVSEWRRQADMFYVILKVIFTCVWCFSSKCLPIWNGGMGGRQKGGLALQVSTEANMGACTYGLCVHVLSCVHVYVKVHMHVCVPTHVEARGQHQLSLFHSTVVVVSLSIICSITILLKQRLFTNPGAHA